MWAAKRFEEGTGLEGVLQNIAGQRVVMAQITLHQNLLFSAKLRHHIAWSYDAGIYTQILQTIICKTNTAFLLRYLEASGRLPKGVFLIVT